MSDEKKEFSKRLRAALKQAGFSERPSVLEREFNAVYWGRSVTFQAVSRWMNGKSIPAQEKLQVLADLLDVDPQALRFGDRAARRLREPSPRWAATADRQDRAVIEVFLQLPPTQRKLVRELILTLAKPSAGIANRAEA